MSDIIAFRYLGGKFSKLDFILPLLEPADREVGHFVEAFCGAASVTFNRPKSVGETINDINGDITTFFRCLRDQPDELLRLLELTPYARGDFEEYKVQDWSELPDLERARRFYTHITQSFCAMPGKTSGWNRQTPKFTRAGKHVNRLEALLPVVTRLQQIAIENMDGVELLKVYGSDPDNFIYLDPPYPDETNTANHGYGEVGRKGGAGELHDALLTAAVEAEAMIAISTYPNERYTDRLEGWECHTRAAFSHAAAANRATGEANQRTEALYVNYQPAKRKQVALCD